MKGQFNNKSILSMFILAAQRNKDPIESFSKYRKYLEDNHDRFPSAAHTLAMSDWYHDPRYHECPHDAWLEWVKVEEHSTGERHEIRSVAITIKLLGAYHDGIIEIHYPKVFEYRLNSLALEGGHRDWRYDELRLNEKGHLIHEIEWHECQDNGSWLIAASEIEFKWTPFKRGSTIRYNGREKIDV
jgi:hypothetical protein